MDKSRLGKVIFITVVIWIGVFLVFAATAITLAFASTPLFSFLILVGLIASSLAANLYWTESHHSPAADDSEPEVGTADSATSRLVRFQSLVLSEPCLSREPPPKPRRSYSSPRVSRTCAVSLEDVPEPEPSCQAEEVDVAAVPEASVEDVQEGGIWPVSLSEIGFSCSPDAPASWKETVWNISAGSSPEGDALLSDTSTCSTRKMTTEGSEGDYLFDDSSTRWTQSGPLTESAFWTAVDSSEGFQQEGDRATLDDSVEDPSDGVRPQEVARESPEEVGAVVEPSTLSLIKAKSPLVPKDGTQGGKQSKKKSKKRFKLVPRFLKGKKKEFSRLN